jgi:hypothetical protein
VTDKIANKTLTRDVNFSVSVRSQTIGDRRSSIWHEQPDMASATIAS